MKQLTNIKIKGKDGTDIPVVIDDQPKLGGPYMEAVEKGVLSRINKIVAEAILTADVRAIDPKFDETLFTARDLDGDGKVTFREYRRYAEKNGVLNNLFGKVDTDGDGFITKPEADAYVATLEN